MRTDFRLNVKRVRTESEPSANGIRTSARTECESGANTYAKVNRIRTESKQGANTYANLWQIELRGEGCCMYGVLRAVAMVGSAGYELFTV